MSASIVQDLFEVHCATHAGGRDTNEDAAQVAVVDGGYAIAVVADGVGGEPWGEIASDRACKAVSMFVTSAVQAAIARRQMPAIKRIVQTSFAVASRRLRQEAVASSRPMGLRTTLIVAIAHGSTLTYGYLGDGGLWIYEAGTDQVTALLAPMRTDDEGFLTGTLGPRIHGTPYVASQELGHDCIVIISTDGLADLIVDAQWAEVGKALAADDKPELTLRTLIEHCAAMTCEGRPVFTDNITVATIRRKQ